jgi:hypothetical protein
MKQLIYFISIFLFSQFVFSGCKSKPEANQERPVMEKVDTSGMEYTSMYICPMHCKGSGSDKPGVCPVCGMDYELNETGK